VKTKKLSNTRAAKHALAAALFPVLMICAMGAVAGEASGDKPIDNGTDPTKFANTVEAKYEYLNLRQGIDSGTLRLTWWMPLGDKRDYSLRFRLPVAMNDVFDNNSHGMGDAAVQLQHVFGLSRQGAFVWQAEATFDTASRAELGTGKNVFSGTFIYARFLSGGAIFAPAIKQSNSFSGQSSRRAVNTTTFDFYYVPKMADPRNLITVDPALSLDWKNNTGFASLAVTAGRVIGPSFIGGNGIVFVKPTVFAGKERPGSWGVEVGYKIIGF
jgi:hypothetical protein